VIAHAERRKRSLAGCGQTQRALPAGDVQLRDDGGADSSRPSVAADPRGAPRVQPAVRWFVGLQMDDRVWGLLAGDVAAAFFEQVIRQAREAGLLSTSTSRWIELSSKPARSRKASGRGMDRVMGVRAEASATFGASGARTTRMRRRRTPTHGVTSRARARKPALLPRTRGDRPRSEGAEPGSEAIRAATTPATRTAEGRLGVLRCLPNPRPARRTPSDAADQALIRRRHLSWPLPTIRKTPRDSVPPQAARERGRPSARRRCRRACASAVARGAEALAIEDRAPAR
jgi:hypothetical protein